MKHGSLFSGIGGFDLAAEWMGWENIFHCEWNEFGKQILKYYWPKSISYDDITKTDFTKHRGAIDILTGGFPCQPYSMAGKRKGKEDERHLWPEMLRAIREIQPTWVVGENVSGLVNWNGGMVFDEVQADLEAEGYEVTPFLLPACGVNAPHKRERVWFIAYSVNNRHNTGREQERKTDGIQEINRKTMDTGKFNRAGISSVTPDPRLLRPEINEKQTAGIEQCGEGITPNTTSEGRKEREQGSRFTDSKENRAGVDGGFERFSDLWDVAYNQGERQPSLNRNKSEVIQAPGGQKVHGGGCNRNDKPGTWSNFPTQPPLCSRNDGLSSRLVGITFPKFRN